MNDWNERSPLLVTCPRGMSPYLAEEFRALGLDDPSASGLTELDLGVRAEGTLTDAMRLCLRSRLGHKVLWEVARFQAKDPDWLYRNARKVPWERWIAPDGYVSVSCAAHTDAVANTMFASLKVKDAIVDRMRQETGQRPDAGREQKGVAVFLHWERSKATLYLDCAGEPLARRGYRVSPHKAPLQETLAACIVLASGYSRGHFVNPMCGSGTLAIEAALLATGRAPGSLGRDFAFRHLRDFPARVWQDLLEDARLDVHDDPGGRIIATDVDPGAVEAARRNAERAGVAGMIEFGVCDFRETDVPDPEGTPGVVALNPEYGMRLGADKPLEALYGQIGDFLKQRCRGYLGAVFTGNPALGKCVGLRTSRRIPLWNARIECRLLTYELYGGTRKAGRPGNGPGNGPGDDPEEGGGAA
ncbi:MAG: class I SAM-dependent RNA methyltransferase [Desulfovibrionaceae bacterium]